MTALLAAGPIELQTQAVFSKMSANRQLTRFKCCKQQQKPKSLTWTLKQASWPWIVRAHSILANLLSPKQACNRSFTRKQPKLLSQMHPTAVPTWPFIKRPSSVTSLDSSKLSLRNGRPRWDRHHNADPSQWNPILDFVRLAIPPGRPMEYAPITAAEWHKALARKKEESSGRVPTAGLEQTWWTCQLTSPRTCSTSWLRLKLVLNGPPRSSQA